MAKQTTKKKKKASPRRRYSWSLTRKELFLWGGAAVLAMVWMFTLGVLVGRGLSPVRFDIEKLKKELIALKEEAIAKKEAEDKEHSSLPDARHLGFYDVLTDKKEEARIKSLSIPEEKTTLARETPEEGNPSLAKKLSVINKKKLYAKAAASGESGSGGDYTLQVASLRDKNKADQMVSMLQGKGYRAYTVTTDISGKGTYHRVRVGHFADRVDAVRMASRLKDDALKPIVIKGE